MTTTARNVSLDGYPLPKEPTAQPESAADPKIDDFVSFPTLPDPQVVANRSLSTIITKTLRKVTNNASNLVHNYTSANSVVTQSALEMLDTQSLVSHGDRSDSTAEAAAGSSNDTDSTILPPKSSANVQPKAPARLQPKSLPKSYAKGAHSETTDAPIALPAVTLMPLSTAPPLVTTFTGQETARMSVASESRPRISSGSVSTDNIHQPRVTSDNHFLKLSTSSVSKTPVALVSTHDVTATPSDPTSTLDSTSHSSLRFTPGETTQETTRAGRDDPRNASTAKTLQNRILSIFNNLPNDIEVSDDDSASDIDIDTEDHETSAPSLVNADSGGMALLSEQRPPKPSIQRSHAPRQGIALRKTSLKTKKSLSRSTSTHFPAAIVDGAKSMIHANITGTGSSTSSVLKSVKGMKPKKKKHRPHRLSNNPLKNGGIPKKYWMDDAFVADCLNCFKQFTAFRRKHHCRFCGQIFCADCTLFISYTQYKEQRHGKVSTKDAKAFKDKLRVCKPCFSDVVVYLSDESLSASSGEEEHGQISDVHTTDGNSSVADDSDTPVSGITENIATRLRSYSASSARSSLHANLPILKLNRTPVFNQRDSPVLQNSSPFLESNQRSPEISHRHPPQMAIPTRRAGESVEIAIPSGSFTQNSSFNSHQTLRSSGHGMLSLNAANNESPDASNWYRNFPRRSASVSSDVGNMKSLSDISSFYKSVINGKYSKVPTKPKLDFSKRAQNIIAQSQDLVADQEEDAESENEDEKVMSLYTSLNHMAATSNMPTRPLNHITSSMTGVPTLLEFPGIEGKYGPANLSQSDAMTRFEFKPIDSVNNASVTETKQRSNFRSNERAKASMQRIKDRRNQKPYKKTRGGVLMIPTIKPHSTADITGPPVFFSPSVTPIPRLAESTPTAEEVPGMRRNSTPHAKLTPNLSEFTMSSYKAKPDLHGPQESVDAETFQGDTILSAHDESCQSLPASSLEGAFDLRLKHMIRQCLEDCDIKERMEQDRWVEVLLKTFASINRIKVIDTLDVKQYIKIKKILGGRVEDTAVFEGLFITKDVDSKKMASSIHQPKIALLVFPLEYLKHKEQFISLRVVNSQQSVYISNLVSRLISLEPDIVLVGDTVCGLAERLLEEANITVISNVKPQVIERISRYTKADIFQSVNDLFFKKGSLGKCEQFEVKKFIFADLIKTYAFFTGSEMESGFTVCLRGGDEEYLSSVKYASETLIPGAFNSRFELSFFKDFSLTFEKVQPDENAAALKNLETLLHLDVEDPGDPKNMCISSMERFGVFNYVKLFYERLLSFSPSVLYPLPMTLANVTRTFETFVHYYDLDKEIQGLTESDEINPQMLSRLNFDYNLDRFCGKSDILTYLKFVSTEAVHHHQRKFNFRLRMWSNSMKNSIYQLYPIFHKSIHFLHSRVSITHATPCYGPVVVVVDYYSDNDKCLGTFLDQTLQESGKVCEECGDLLLNHYKTYVHGNYKIDLIVERIDDNQILEQYKDTNQRIMWSYCPECNKSSPIAAMSDETYFLSLGKFFELNFWSRHTWHQNHCEHDFFKSQVKYFGIRGYFIRIEISDIVTYEVVVPRKKLEFVASLNLELKLETLKTIQESSTRFFQSILNRLNRIKVDTFEKAEAGRQRIEELKKKVHKDKDFIATKTLLIYESTKPTNFMSLNVIQRDIQEMGVSWDKEFNDFEKQFLPTENEITKITQFHLRNFLMDKLDIELKKDTKLESPETDNASETSKSSSDAESVKSPHFSVYENQRKLGKLAGDDLFTIGSRRIPLTIIEDKIMKIRQSFEEDLNKHMMKSPARSKSDTDIEVVSPESAAGSQPPKRVQDLTNYFNQMTLEFQKQREAVLERQSSKFKAVPVVKSQPIVEIYDNIEDVVDVDHRAGASMKVLLNPQKSNESQRAKEESTIRSSEDLGLRHSEETMESSSNPTKASKDENKARIEIPQPEKNSLLKSLSNFWADRSATLWEPLEYPLDFTEHTFVDSEVIVREDEPCSLVAFCLSTGDYKQKIAGMGSNENNVNDDKESETLEMNEQFKKKSEHFAKLERKFKKRTEQLKNDNSGLEIVMNKTKSNHLKYQFVDGSTEMSCKIFYSEQFDALRKACGVDDSFIQSLSRCVKWDTKGGKSGSNFLKTLDNRYIIKELSKSELESFVSIAPFYFKYISQSTFNTLTTALAKIFGFYQVEFKNSANGKVFRMDFLIMENLFYNRKTTRIFDLKGSMRNRHVKQTGKENEVLLDENMIEYIYESPVFVKEQLKKLLRGSLFNDTSFLSAMDVMDYSLVIGIDDVSGKLYVGIIDWLRTFTWDKKVENWVKGKSLVGKKGKDPTIVTPKQYRTRFREAMDRYILEVPDIWYEGSN